MRVVFRADAGVAQGTGHVMRSLTLAEELLKRGHQVELAVGGDLPGWLQDAIRKTGVGVRSCAPDVIDAAEILEVKPDWVVVDSYRISPESISALNEHVPVLAIVDGPSRGIRASLYLDHNLGAEDIPRPKEVHDRFLSGAGFSLIRDAVLHERRPEPWRLRATPPEVLAFAGGTDPTGASIRIARALSGIDAQAAITVIAPAECHRMIREITQDEDKLRVIAPTLELPRLMGRADVIVAGAGTSAWELCTLGVPSVMIAVVDNQRASLQEAVSRELVLGIDATAERAAKIEECGELVSRLLLDLSLRREISDRCLELFDGMGKGRVADALESGNYRRGVSL